MTLIHIYDKETGKFLRSQEPAIDPLESQAKGTTVYSVYDNSTELPLPECGEHELPFFIDGAWVVRGQYKNVEVYNTTTKNFEYCQTDELAANQHYIDDKAGIERFKRENGKYIVDEETWTIIDNPLWEVISELREIEAALAKADEDYQTALNTPIIYEATGKLYKPKWVDDGTYEKLLTCIQYGLTQFPVPIWDATEKAENMVQMDQQTFMGLIAFLAAAQQTAFNTRKITKSQLIERKEALENSGEKVKQEEE